MTGEAAVLIGCPNTLAGHDITARLAPFQSDGRRNTQDKVSALMDEAANQAKINITGGKAPQNPSGVARKPFLLPIKVSSYTSTCVCVGVLGGGGGYPPRSLLLIMALEPRKRGPCWVK